MTTPRPVVLVEGDSDAVVVTTLARGHGLALDVVAMQGITNVRAHLTRLRTERPGANVLGLYDDAEERYVAGAWRGLGATVVARTDLVALGFFACVADLEDELIRSLGGAAVEDALAELGDLHRFRTFQHQPEWRDRPLADQLHRFAGSGAGRKIALAERLALRLDERRTPEPLVRLLARAAGGA